jgi:hypothetical protein
MQIKVNNMTLDRRRMKKYHPRRSRQTVKLQKQQLEDLEHMLSMDLGSFLVLKEEGNREQAEIAMQKAKNSLMKFGPDMRKLGEHMGGVYPGIVANFLDSMDSLLHSPIVDEAKVAACYHAAQKLEKKLHAA